mgnify:CR=1 FL=1
MGYLHYKTEFTSDGGQDYKIEIRSKSDSTGTDIDYTSGKNGFKLKYKQGKFLRLAMCMPSTVQFSFNVTGSTTRNFIHDVLSTSTGDWYIRIFQDTTLYWGGWITPEFDTYADMPYPYFVNIKANDSIGRLVDKYNHNVAISSTNDYQELTYPLEFFDDLYDLETVLGTSYRWNFLFDWWNENTSYLSTVNPLRKTYYNRAAFVWDNENFPLVIESYLKELNGVLKTIGGRFFQAGGLYWLQQDAGLDSNNIDYFKAISPSVSGTEVQETSVNNTVTIDNTAAISATNANILRGTTFTQDPELNSVRVNYIHGNSGVLFDTSEDYSSLTTIGVLGSGSNSYQLDLNMVYREFFTSSAVTPISEQGDAMRCKWEITLKVGTYYFTDSGWTTTPGVLTKYSGFSTIIPGNDTTYEEDFTTGIDRASLRIYNSIDIPDIPTFGEVQFKIEPTAYYFNGTYLPDNVLNLINNIASTGNSSLNSATPTSTSLVLLNTILNGISAPNSMFPVGSASEDTTIGSQYIVAQSPATQNADLDLGDLALGTPPTTVASNIKTLTYLDGSDYKNAEGFRRGNTGTYRTSSALLLREYLQATDKPVTILQATIISQYYTPRMTLKYASKIGGGLDRFIFTRGEFIAARDEWRGEWYKSEQTASPGFDETDIPIYTDGDIKFVDPIDPTEPEPPNPPNPPNPSLNPHTAPKLSSSFNSNIIGELSSALAAGTQTKIFIGDLKCSLASGQKITVCDIDGSNPFELTTSASARKAATEVDFVSFTSPKAYATGFLLTIASDIQNHLSPTDIYSTAIYLSPLDFTQVSATSTNLYTRNAGGSSVLSSSTAKAYANFKIPLGYKATHIDFYASGNVGFNVNHCVYTTNTATLLEAGTTNTQVTFSPTQPTGLEGKYCAVEYDPSSTTVEIYGVKITIAKQ